MGSAYEGVLQRLQDVQTKEKTESEEHESDDGCYPEPL